MLRKTVQEIARFFGHEKNHQKLVTSAAFDSQKVESGALFFAIQGNKKDGHDFLEDVAKKGGVAAVVSNTYKGPSFSLSLIPVADVRSALHALAREIHQKNTSIVIAVSGSVGKTTTKEFIATLLSEKYVVEQTPNNWNSQLSLPLWLMNRKGGEEVLVLEMGMSFLGEISRLVEIAPPNIGVLTSVDLAHAANFNSVNMIAQAKSELFSHPLTKIGFFHQKTLDYNEIKETICKKITYGEKGDYELECVNKKGVVFEKNENSPYFPLPFFEEHFLENFLGAAAVARYMDLSWEEIIKGSKRLKSSKHRFKRSVKRGVVCIDDSYNASPASMKAALLALSLQSKKNKVIAVLGAMKELGEFSFQSHLEVGLFALQHIDHLLCLGRECQPMMDAFKEKKPAELFTDLKLLKQRLIKVVSKGDVVLIKGSNSLKMWTLLEAFE